MGVLGTAASKAVDAATGASHGTTLDEFLAKFSSTAGVFVDTIDPLHTFEVEFKFYPTKDLAHDGVTTDTNNNSWLSKLGGSLAESGMNALNNLGDNLTGGMLGSIVNSQKNLLSLRTKFSGRGKETFMKYVAEGNLLVNSDNYIQQAAGIGSGASSESQLVLNLGFYVQNITIPKLQIRDGQTLETSFGTFSIPGTVVQPDTNQLIMSVINTKVPLLDRVFYPWMREVTLPYWSYDRCPYTTATITIDMTKHADFKYVFYGCRPTVIQTEQPTQEPDTNVTRDVTFQFDYMIVNSSLTSAEDWKSKLLSTASSLASSAGNLIGV